MNDAPDPIGPAGRSAVLLGGLVTAFGIAVALVGGYLNERFPHFRPYFLGVGIAAFVLPGTLSLVGGIQLLRRRPLGTLALVGGVLQAVAAVGFTVAQLFLRPITPVPMALTILWAVAAAWSAVLALRASRFVRASSPGFQLP